jgi:anti-anti-sigma factor
MQITTETDGAVLELRLEGRLDNEAADDFVALIDDVLHKGHHAAMLNMQGIDYVSSAGLGALVRVFKKFQAIHGVFGVGFSSPQVTEILELTGLNKLLVCDPEVVRAKCAGGDATIEPTFRIAVADGLEFAIYDLQPTEKLQCQIWGNTKIVGTSQVSDAEVRAVPFRSDCFGLGIGAFGKDRADCANRFGELVAAAGGVAVQPTPEGGKPDYQLASGGFVPQPIMLSGLSFAGEFSQMMRFESRSTEGRTGLSSLVQQCLEQSRAEIAGIVIVAEAAGLIGTRLRRSPAGATGDSGLVFSHPEIRQWFSFAAEHIFPHSLVVAAGVASRGVPKGEAAALAPLLRPLGRETDLLGHFHAAAFSYRPLKKRRLNLQETVQNLFNDEELQAVMHLLNDDRAISGSGESQFVAGACWVGPIAQIATEGHVE